MPLNKNDYGRDGKLKKSGLDKFLPERLENIFRQMDTEEKRKNPPELSEDTKLRLEIQKDIDSLINQGKGKIEILAYLNNKYKNTYLSKYFESYVDNKLKNIINRESEEVR